MRVTVHRLVSERRRLVPRPQVTLDLPLERFTLPSGRCLLKVQAEGFAELSYPLRVDRAEHHLGRVRLYTPAEVGQDWVLVPGGAFLLGGDHQARQAMPRCRPTLGDRFMQRTCVTVGHWLRYLHALPREEARSHVPGVCSPTGLFTPWWSEVDGRIELPEGWDPRWPIVGVDAEDAAAYAAWVSRRTGRRQRLPTEEEWEKAARGVDGRAWPWGDHFDPTFAHMRASRPGEPSLGPVGAFPVDCSPYGCLDMAGCVQEWTGSWMDNDLVVLRGGSWADERDDLRCAARSGRPPHYRSDRVGFRLVSDQPAIGVRI